MLPFLFTHGQHGHPISTYLVLLCFAYLLGVVIWIREADKKKLNLKIIFEASLLSIFPLIAGGKLLYFLSVSTEEKTQNLGLVVLGAFLALFIFLVLFFRWRKIPQSLAFDALAPALASAQAVGRVACWAQGCCFGKSCTLPWAVSFTNPLSSAPLNQPLHPTQIYEILGLITIYWFCVAQNQNLKAKPLSTFSLYLISYGVLRFTVEFFRGDDSRGFWGPLSTSQWLCALFISLGLLLLLSMKKPAKV